MDIIIKIVNILGNVALVVGLLWALVGVVNFFQSKKNGDKKGMDDGVEGILYGGIVGIVVKGIAAGIITALQGMTF